MSGTKRKKFYGFGYLNFFAPKTISLVNYSWRPQSKFDFSGFFGPYSLHCSTLSKSIRTRQTIMESHRMLAFSFQRESNHFFVHRSFECLIKYAWIQNHTWWANCRTNKCMAFTADQPGGPSNAELYMPHHRKHSPVSFSLQYLHQFCHVDANSKLHALKHINEIHRWTREKTSGEIWQ